MVTIAMPYLRLQSFSSDEEKISICAHNEALHVGVQYHG
jgi:hypothetical protein